MSPYPDEHLDPDRVRGAEDEQIVRAAFASLPVVPCPDAVLQRIEQRVAQAEATRSTPPSPDGWRHLTRRWLPVGAGLAAAAVAWLLLARPIAAPEPSVLRPDNVRTVVAGSTRTGGAAIAQACRDARQGLLLATRMLQRSEQILFDEALAKPLSGAVHRSLRLTVSRVKGGRG